MSGGRPERGLDPERSPLAAFAADLRGLRVTAGSPTYRQMAATTGVPVGSLARAAGGTTLPGVRIVRAYVQACGGDETWWIARWRLLAGDEQARRRRQRLEAASSTARPSASPPDRPAGSRRVVAVPEARRGSTARSTAPTLPPRAAPAEELMGGRRGSPSAPSAALQRSGAPGPA